LTRPKVELKKKEVTEGRISRNLYKNHEEQDQYDKQLQDANKYGVSGSFCTIGY